MVDLVERVAAAIYCQGSDTPFEDEKNEDTKTFTRWQAKAAIMAMKSEIAAKDAEIERLREALKPLKITDEIYGHLERTQVHERMRELSRRKK